MTTITQTTCRSCNAPIFWALTRDGKREPLDFDPVADGNIEVVGETADHDPLARHLKKGEAESDTLLDPPARFKSHFATCPDGPSWRKK